MTRSRNSPPRKNKGDQVVAFFRKLRLPDGTPYKLDPWQEGFLRALFGTARPNGHRQYRTAFLTIARRNGKTFLVAGIVLYLLLTERRQRIFAAASTREQAAEIYLYCKGMADVTPGLKQRMRGTDYYRRIVCTSTATEFKCISSDAGGHHGKGAKFVIGDEVHAWRSGGHKLYEALTTSQGNFAEDRLFLAITTAAAAGDENTAAGVLYRDARRVQKDPSIDPGLLVCIHEADPDCALDDEEQWRKANPALGNFRSIEEIREKCLRAQREPVWEASFRQLYLNQWFVGGSTYSHWLLPIWDRGCGELPKLDGEPCYAGVDVAQRYDYCACTLVFPIGGAASPACYALKPHYWLPEGVVDEKSAREKAPIRAWAKAGWLTLQPGQVLDLGAVLEGLLALHKRYQVRAWAFDPWHDQYLVGALEAAGVRSVCEVRQTWQGLSAACKEWEALLREGRLRHGDHPVLTHQALAIAVARDPSGNLKPDRKLSPLSIDGIPAGLMALARSFADRHAKPTVYSQRGLLRF